MVACIPKAKINFVRSDYISGMSDSCQLAATLGITRETVNKYRIEFREIERLYPEKLDNFRFRLPKKKYVKPTDHSGL
jgi:hypothetical protein